MTSTTPSTFNTPILPPSRAPLLVMIRALIGRTGPTKSERASVQISHTPIHTQWRNEWSSRRHSRSARRGIIKIQTNTTITPLIHKLLLLLLQLLLLKLKPLLLLLKEMEVGNVEVFGWFKWRVSQCEGILENWSIFLSFLVRNGEIEGFRAMIVGLERCGFKKNVLGKWGLDFVALSHSSMAAGGIEERDDFLEFLHSFPCLLP